MEWYWMFTALIGGVLGFMALGMPVAFSFLVVNLIGAYFVMGGWNGVFQAVANSSYSVTTFAFVPIPMFLVVGELFFKTGIATRVFDSVDQLLGRIPGRLCYVTLGVGTIFAALTGSAMANTAMMGSMMVPEMTQRGYKPHVVMGTIMGAGGLAILIPPSGLAILLGALARIDIAALMVGGLIPAAILAAFYFFHVYLQIRRDPEAAPPYSVPTSPLSTRLVKLVVNVVPTSIVIIIKVGVIVLALATPTEASAFGVLGVLILAACYRVLTWRAVIESLQSALRGTAMILLIILGSGTFTQLLAFSGASEGLVQWATGFDLTPVMMVVAMFLVISFLGLFMDEVSMMMLTLPVFMPIAIAMHMDLIWLGVVLLMSLEIGLLSPPFGLSLFVMKSVAPPGTTMSDVNRAAVPYMAWQVVLVIMILMYPPVATWLPSLMAK